MWMPCRAIDFTNSIAYCMKNLLGTFLNPFEMKQSKSFMENCCVLDTVVTEIKLA